MTTAMPKAAAPPAAPPLSLALSPRIISKVSKFKPDIIHASSPGIMVFGALFIAKLLCVPIVMSYHTHVPVYIPRYTFSWLVQPMWWVIKFLHRAADLTLVPSAAIAKDLMTARVTAANKIRLWNKGVDSKSFNPKYRSHEMRLRLRHQVATQAPFGHGWFWTTFGKPPVLSCCLVVTTTSQVVSW